MTTTDTEVNPKPPLMIPGKLSCKSGQENPTDALIMDNLEISLATPVYRDSWNKSVDIVEILIKPKSSKHFGYPKYSMYEPGPTIAVSGPHEEFLTVLSGYD